MSEFDETIHEEDNANAENTAGESAGQSSPEDALKSKDPWESIAKDQQSMIESLTAHIESLNAQISKLIQSGAQITDATASNPVYMENENKPELPKDYVPLRELGREIGKPPKKE